MRKAAAKKLRSRAGETIGETLVALLISSLALLMLAGAVSAASRAVQQSKTKIEEYYSADKGMAEQSSAGGALTVSLQEKTGGTEPSLGTFSYSGTYYKNDAYNSTVVVSYVIIPKTGEEGP